jgi:L-lactate permease
MKNTDYLAATLVVCRYAMVVDTASREGACEPMKLALISVGLFLVSYIAVNGGLGPNPFQLAVPLLVVLATTVAARWVMRRGHRGTSRKGQAWEMPDTIMPAQRRVPPDNVVDKVAADTAPRTPGSKARKLF